MDPHQTSALNALAPFLALAPSATSPRAAADLVRQATSAPQAYVFAELLQAPQIQALRTAEPQWAAWLRVLELFCWGTWAEYQATPNLPTLTDAQADKLRLLTLVTLASAPDAAAALTYPALQRALDLPTPAALEGLVTHASHAGLLRARLDPRGARVHVASVAPLRDLAPGAAPRLAAELGAWEARCAAALAALAARGQEVRRGARAREAGRREWEGRWEEAVKGKSKDGDKLPGAPGYEGALGEKVGRGAKREGGEAGLEQGEEMDGEGAGRDAKRGARFGLSVGRRLGGS